MFIKTLTYKAPLENIDKELENHISFFKKQYASGNFQASVRKKPRTGRIILAWIFLFTHFVRQYQHEFEKTFIKLSFT